MADLAIDRAVLTVDADHFPATMGPRFEFCPTTLEIAQMATFSANWSTSPPNRICKNVWNISVRSFAIDIDDDFTGDSARADNEQDSSTTEQQSHAP